LGLGGAPEPTPEPPSDDEPKPEGGE
jgi:hypothetical protein